jgi:uncharacterized repeat protein (TIGR01451 family)
MPSIVSAQDLSLNQTEANSLQEFTENTLVSIMANQVTVDRLIGSNMSIGASVTPTLNYSGGGLFLPAGFYNSHLFHLDGVGTSGSITITGTLMFDEEVVALIYSNSGTANLLNASDSIFGNATAYDNNGSRRLEANDKLTLDDAYTITYKMRAGNNFTDNLRVLTKPLEADIDSSKTVTIHSSSPTDCDLIPGVPGAGSPTSMPGSCMEYTISLSNAGPGDATGLSVEDVLDSSLIFQAADFSGFVSSDPSYAESTPAIGTSCGGLTCIVRVDNAGIDSGGSAEIIVRAIIK